MCEVKVVVVVSCRQPKASSFVDNRKQVGRRQSSCRQLQKQDHFFWLAFSFVADPSSSPTSLFYSPRLQTSPFLLKRAAVLAYSRRLRGEGKGGEEELTKGEGSRRFGPLIRPPPTACPGPTRRRRSNNVGERSASFWQANSGARASSEQDESKLLRSRRTLLSLDEERCRGAGSSSLSSPAAADAAVHPG